jgi:hypothetical protein
VWADSVDDYQNMVARLPKWARPAVHGAVFGGVHGALISAAGVLISRPSWGVGVLEAAVVVGGSAFMGALFGISADANERGRARKRARRTQRLAAARPSRHTSSPSSSTTGDHPA